MQLWQNASKTPWNIVPFNQSWCGHFLSKSSIQRGIDVFESHIIQAVLILKPVQFYSLLKMVKEAVLSRETDHSGEPTSQMQSQDKDLNHPSNHCRHQGQCLLILGWEVGENLTETDWLFTQIHQYVIISYFAWYICICKIACKRRLHVVGAQWQVFRRAEFFFFGQVSRLSPTVLNSYLKNPNGLIECIIIGKITIF